MIDPRLCEFGLQHSLVTNSQRKLHFPSHPAPQSETGILPLSLSRGGLISSSLLHGGVPFRTPSFIPNFVSWAGPELHRLTPLPQGIQNQFSTSPGSTNVPESKASLTLCWPSWVSVFTYSLAWYTLFSHQLVDAFKIFFSPRFLVVSSKRIVHFVHSVAWNRSSWASMFLQNWLLPVPPGLLGRPNELTVFKIISKPMILLWETDRLKHLRQQWGRTQRPTVQGSKWIDPHLTLNYWTILMSVSEEMQMTANLEKLHFCHLKSIYGWDGLELIFLFYAWVQAWRTCTKM